MGIRSTSVHMFGTALAGLALTAAGPLANASGATGVSTANLSLATVSALVADSVHQHLFISGGSSNTVLVTDFTGNTVTTLTGLPGASSMALSGNGAILYVALSGSDTVAAVNTATLQEAALYFTGGRTPGHLAVVGDEIWFSYGSPGGSGVGLGAIDPAALTVTLTGESTFYDAPLLAASPTAPGMLVAGNPAASPSVVESFDVGSGTPVAKATSDPWTQSDGCENLGNLAVTAGGADVITACGYPYHGSSLNLDTMTEDATYQTGPYPTAVAVAPGGTIALGVKALSSSVYLFTPGGSTPTSTYTLGGFGVFALAWSADGQSVFAITADSTGASPALNVISLTG